MDSAKIFDGESFSSLGVAVTHLNFDIFTMELPQVHTVFSVWARELEVPRVVTSELTVTGRVEYHDSKPGIERHKSIQTDARFLTSLPVSKVFSLGSIGFNE